MHRLLSVWKPRACQNDGVAAQLADRGKFSCPGNNIPTKHCFQIRYPYGGVLAANGHALQRNPMAGIATANEDADADISAVPSVPLLPTRMIVSMETV